MSPGRPAGFPWCIVSITNHQLVEGAAGVAIAGFLKVAREYAGQTVAIVICGGNVAPAVENLIKS